ncbi:MAG: ComEC family competence protein [Rikenellaceae bacterium]|nr:ComEC family competence protein [Rikenellaceae bacterium]
MKLRHLLEHLSATPMLKALIPFVVGIALADLYVLPLWLLAGAFVCTGILALLLRSQTAAIGMLLAAGFAIAEWQEPTSTLPLGIDTGYELRIDGIPTQRNGYTAAEATITAWRDPLKGQWHAAEDRILLRADTLITLRSDERLRCHGRLRPLQGGAESYRRLMARRGMVGVLWIGERNLLEQHPEKHDTWHSRAVKRLKRLTLPTEAEALVRAMTAGDRSGIDSALRDNFARSGFSHLLAVSGLHTGIVFALINLLLWGLPLVRRGHLWRTVAVTVAVWLFVAVAGFPPSAIRAGVMCTLLQFSLISGSEYSALNALATAAFGMLLWNPAWLGDISFQLSFIAVAAILCWGIPLCRRLRSRWRGLNIVIDALIISVVANIATIPLVSHTFGIVSLTGILLNPIAILLATGIVAGGVIWLLLPFGWVATVVEPFIAVTTEALGTLAHQTAELHGGVIEYALPTGAMVTIYLVFIGTTLVAWSQKPKKIVTLRR